MQRKKDLKPLISFIIQEHVLITGRFFFIDLSHDQVHEEHFKLFNFFSQIL